MIFVGVPSVGPPTWGLFDSLMNLQVGQKWQFMRQTGYGGVALACNSLVEAFLKTDATHFVLMANDAQVHQDSVKRLLSWDVDIVAALVFTRFPPIVPGVYTEYVDGKQWPPAVKMVHEWIMKHPVLMQRNKPSLLKTRPDDALIPVLRLGTHVTLIKRRVFETLPSPWFKEKDILGGGEDFHFCAQAHAAGFQPHIDLSVVAGHVSSDQCIGALDFVTWARVTDWPDAIKPD